MERVATCFCGQLSVTMEGEPQMHGLCHCRQCQKMSGGAFTYSSYWPRSAVKNLSGKFAVYRKVSESGRWIDLHFCPTCAGKVYWYLEFNPNVIGLPIGAFEGAMFPPPVYSLWHDSKHKWVEVPGTCATFDQQPTSWG